MTFDTVLGIALDGASFALFALTFCDGLRHREAVWRAVGPLGASTITVLHVSVHAPLAGEVPA